MNTTLQYAIVAAVVSVALLVTVRAVVRLYKSRNHLPPRCAGCLMAKQCIHEQKTDNRECNTKKCGTGVA